MARNGERGFTLVEVLVSLAIATVLGVFLLQALASMLHAGSMQAARFGAQAASDALVDRLEADEDSAWAIFTPDTDVRGASNADGHEVDFFNRDAKNEAYFWAYSYDAVAQSVTRYVYSAPGAKAVADQTFDGIGAFFARTYPVAALLDSTSAIYSPLYSGASLENGAVLFYGNAYPKIAGGNQITYVRIGTAATVRELQLSTQTAPSGFTVVLHYTPAPTPTPAPAPSTAPQPTPTPTPLVALNAWPQYVELPVSGQALQTSFVPAPHDMAYTLNRLFGGGVADAALTPCALNQARAFTDNTFTTPLAGASMPAAALPITGSTDASGCVSINDGNNGSGTTGSNVELYEPGNTSAVQQGGSNCTLGVKTTNELPGSGVGPNVGLFNQGSQPQGACSATWTDSNAQPTTATVWFKVPGPCNLVNGWHWGQAYDVSSSGVNSYFGSGWAASYSCAESGSYQKCLNYKGGAGGKECQNWTTVNWAENFPFDVGYLTTSVSSSPTFAQPATAAPSVLSKSTGSDYPDLSSLPGANDIAYGIVDANGVPRSQPCDSVYNPGCFSPW